MTDTDEIRLLRDRVRELEEALKDVFALMDEGFLVRNIDGDGASDWAVKLVPYMVRLKKAYDALGKTDD